MLKFNTTSCCSCGSGRTPQAESCWLQQRFQADARKCHTPKMLLHNRVREPLTPPLGLIFSGP